MLSPEARHLGRAQTENTLAWDSRGELDRVNQRLHQPRICEESQESETT